MRCDLCGQNEATVVVYFAHRRRASARERLFVCRACAEKFSMAYLLEKKEELCGFSESPEGERKGPPARVCPFCGFSWLDFWEKGLLGCSYCYSVFREEIGRKISQTQSGVFHTGKAPVRWLQRQQVKQYLSRMLTELKKCVEEENYEKAEHFKHLINELRARLE